MDPAANGVAVWQLLAVAIAVALVGGGWFWHRYRTHDEHGRPRPPNGPP